MGGVGRTTSLLVVHFALQNTKSGSEKRNVQNPARISPQIPPAGGKKAEALCAEAIQYDFTKSENWRRGRDSNPRSAYTDDSFQDCSIQPLWHLSGLFKTNKNSGLWQ